MESFKDFFKRRNRDDSSDLLLEYECYRLIPGTNNSYREDPANTSTLTQKHAHVYAKQKGKGRQLYAVNMDGSGHDGSSTVEIPGDHADHFRRCGYSIPDTNILEMKDLAQVSREDFLLLLG